MYELVVLEKFHYDKTKIIDFFTICQYFWSSFIFDVTVSKSVSSIPKGLKDHESYKIALTMSLSHATAPLQHTPPRTTRKKNHACAPAFLVWTSSILSSKHMGRVSLDPLKSEVFSNTTFWSEYKSYFLKNSLPTKNFFPNSSSLSPIYDSFKSKVLKMDGNYFYYISFS